MSESGGMLRGRVTSGIGGHTHWMTVHADLYESTTGMRMFPGSLNLVLSEPWHPHRNVFAWNRPNTEWE